MHDVTIIGSGYGGAVMAARLAPRARVLLIERGRRWRSGEFPTTLTGLGAMYRSRRNPLGIWEMRLGAGTGNALASAYGGASPLNYGITAKPDPHAFDGWPIAAGELDPYYQRAREVLRPSPNPVMATLGDQAFLDQVEPGRRVDLENTIDWEKCEQCGHCVPGCNHDAKRSLDRSYLALAEQQGIDLELATELVRVLPLPNGGYRLQLRDTASKQPLPEVLTRRLVLATGTFGTLDLLHRMRDQFPTATRFGTRMSMNGDGLAFLYNTGHRLSGEHGAPITTSVRIPYHAPNGRTRTLMVMSGRIPYSALRLASIAMAAVAGGVSGDYRGADDDNPQFQRLRRRLADLLRIMPGNALSQTFMYKLDAQDSARGEVTFDDAGQSAIDWPDYADDPILQFADRRLHQWAEQIGATVLTGLHRWPGMRSFGVHPLGGCGMGRDAASGVVDPDGRLFRPDGGVYPNLRIVDASILPDALGVPSSFTIAALAERIAEQFLTEL